MSEVTVRSARPEDAEAIAALHVAGWRRAFAGIVDDAFLAGLDSARRAEFWRRAAAEAQSGQVHRVVVRAGRIAGFCSSGPYRTDDGIGVTAAGSDGVGVAADGVGAAIGEIYAIYIDLDQHGTGLGKALVIDALDQLRAAGYRRARLWTLERNTLGREFYDRSGWVLDGVRRDERVGADVLAEVRYTRDLG